MLGRLTWNNLALTRPHIVAWMTGVRTVGDTLLIECSISDLRYALSTALSPLPCTDATACPAPSHSKAGYAFMRTNYAQCSESSKFHGWLAANGGPANRSSRLGRLSELRVRGGTSPLSSARTTCQACVSRTTPSPRVVSITLCGATQPFKPELRGER